MNLACTGGTMFRWIPKYAPVADCGALQRYPSFESFSLISPSLNPGYVRPKDAKGSEPPS
jgi:hypothetical protein